MAIKEYVRIGKRIFFGRKKRRTSISSLTISITSRCNSKCRTCGIWKKKEKKNQFSLAEWDKTLEKIGPVPWFTITGGEPFLNKNISEIVSLIEKHNCPAFITIPTNGILTDKILKNVKKILKATKAQIMINVSIDDIGARDDSIRGIKGSFENAIATIEGLKKIKSETSNLNVGVNTVISRYNIKRISNISEFIKEQVNPDSHSFEIAQEREELSNKKMPFLIKKSEKIECARFFLNNENGQGNSAASKIKGFLRRKYYLYLLEHETYGKGFKCGAGKSFVHISENGDVWPCCVRCESMGNLREFNYSLPALLKSQKSAEAIKKIKDEKCSCTMVNAYYTSMISRLV